MWKTRDGYEVGLPRFRRRRMMRRLGQRNGGRDELRSLGRTLALVLRGARWSGALQDGGRLHHPVFHSRIGGQPLVIFTRTVGPGRLELLYIRRQRQS
jgi:hypothetical protein